MDVYFWLFKYIKLVNNMKNQLPSYSSNFTISYENKLSKPLLVMNLKNISGGVVFHVLLFKILWFYHVIIYSDP